MKKSDFDPIWEKIHAERMWGRYPNEEVIRFMMRNFPDKSLRGDTRVLDLGCGAGANLRFLAAEGFDAHAVDGAASAVRRSEEFLAEVGLSAKIEQRDMTDLACYESNYFDAVIDCASMANIRFSRIHVCLNEVNRVLKPGGRYLTMLYGSGSTGYIEGDLVEKRTYTNIPDGPFQGVGTITLFDAEAIKNLADQCGFNVADWWVVTRAAHDWTYRYEYHVTELVKP